MAEVNVDHAMDLGGLLSGPAPCVSPPCGVEPRPRVWFWNGERLDRKKMESNNAPQWLWRMGPARQYLNSRYVAASEGGGERSSFPGLRFSFGARAFVALSARVRAIRYEPPREEGKR